MTFIESHIVNGTEFDGPEFAIANVAEVTAVLRGKDLVPAMDHGRRWRRKRLGGGSENWRMWVCDAASNGSFAATEQARRGQYHTNRDAVLEILYTNHAASGYDAPLKVVRKMASGASSHEYRVNYGEASGEINIPDYKMFGYSEFTVTVKYPDARWYESDSSGTKTVSTIADASSPFTVTVNPGGTALMTRMVITLSTGTNPYILNSTTGSKLTRSGTGVVEFDTTNYTAFSGVSNVTGSVDRTGSTTVDWFQLRPGVANVISSNVGFTITYTKAYI